jgi:hypothetical protein
MGVGLECYNDAGHLQFSTQTILPALVAKGVHDATLNSGSSNTPGWHSTRLDIGGLSESAFICIRPNDGASYAFFYVERVGGTVQYHFFTNGSGSFTWWAFDRIASITGNTGIILFDGAGQVCWQISARPLRVSGVVQQAISSGAIGDQGFGIPGGRDVAVAVGCMAGWENYVQIGTPDGQPQRYSARYRLDTIRSDGGQYVFALQVVDQSSGFTTNPEQASYSRLFGARNVMIVDVTNY